jgi:hypothetical protein
MPALILILGLWSLPFFALFFLMIDSYREGQNLPSKHYTLRFYAFITGTSFKFWEIPK